MYWGGTQPWSFYFTQWWGMFSIVGILFVLGFGRIIYKKKTFKPEFLLLILWASGFILMAIVMPHKEERFVLPILPAISLISGVFIQSLKKYKKILLLASVLILTVTLVNSYTHQVEINTAGGEWCFLDAMSYINDYENQATIITDDFAVVHYYVKVETQYYPTIIDDKFIREVKNQKQTPLYFLYTNRLLDGSNQSIERYNYLEENLEKVFDCAGEGSFVSLYYSSKN